MRIILSILILIFNLQSWTKADDIKDFEIEGMSIGDSLLKFMNKNEISNSKRNYFNSKRKYYVVGYNNNLTTYETVDIYLKTDDKDYIIKNIIGFIFLNKNDCLSKKDEINKEIGILFKDSYVDNYTETHQIDKTKKSKVYTTVYYTNSDNDDHVRIECTDWSKEIEKEKNWSDNLGVSAVSDEINKWFNSGYE